MVDEFRSRKHRLDLPAVPKTTDPVAMMNAMKSRDRIIQDQFNRLADDLYRFKKATYDAAIIPIPGVAAIETTATQFSVSATWENPDATDITPTHVRVRVLEASPDDWAEYTYPIGSWSFFGLTPNTQYTIQVQLVARYEDTQSFVSTTRNCPSMPVLRVAESAIKSKVFTTLPGVGPPVDAEIDTTTVDFTFPDPPDGTPGAVGSAFCWWEYGFQVFEGSTGNGYVDIGSLTEVAGDVGDVTIDLNGLPFSSYESGSFRMRYREVCNGVDGAWLYGDAFMKYDLDVLCGGLTQSESAADLPYSNADMFSIVPCMNTGHWLKQRDGVSATEYIQAYPGYRGYARTSGEWTLYASDTSNLAVSDRVHVPQLSSTLTAISTLHAASDFSFCIDIYLSDLALGSPGLHGTPWTILNIGNKIKLNIVQHTATYEAIVNVPREGGGVYVFRASGLAPDTWNSIFYVHDVSEATGRVLYHNGVEVARSVSGSNDNDFDDIDGSIQINTFNLQRTRKVYGWKRAVTPAEIEAGYVEGLLTSAAGWWDASTYTSGAWLNQGTEGATLNFTLGAATAAPSFASGEFTFDGVNDYMYIADSSAIDIAAGESFTLGIIFNPTGATTNGARIISKDPGSGAIYNMQMTTGPFIAVRLNDGSSAPQTNVAAPTVGSYQMAALVRDCTNNLLLGYKNSSVVTIATTTEAAINNTAELRIGTTGTAIPMKVKAAFLFKRALTAAELLAIQHYYGL